MPELTNPRTITANDGWVELERDAADDKFVLQCTEGSFEVAVTNDGNAPADTADGLQFNDTGGLNSWADEVRDSSHVLYARAITPKARLIFY